MPWVLFLVSLYIIVQVLPDGSGILSALSARLLFAIVAILTMIQFLSAFFWVAHIDTTPLLYAFGVFALSIIIYIVAYRRDHIYSLRVSRLDTWLLLPALLISGLYTARVLLPAENDQVSIIRATAIAGDDTAHATMYEALLRNEGNVLFRPKRAQTMAIPSQASYPMGWGLSLATLALSINPHLDGVTVSEAITSYFYAKVFSIFLCVSSLTLLVFLVAERVSIKKTIFDSFMLYSIIAFVAFLMIFPQVFEGFFSFLPILMYSFIALSLIISDRQKNKYSLAFDFMFVMCIAGSAFSWILTAPALLVAYIASSWNPLSKKEARSVWIKRAIIVLVSALPIVFEVYILQNASNNSVTALTNPGGITLPDNMFFLLSIAGILFLTTQKIYAETAKKVVLFIAPLLLIMTIVMLYISLKSQVITYYFQKIEIVVLAVLMPIVLIAVYHYMINLDFSANKRINPYITRAVFVSLLAVIVPTIIGFQYFSNTVQRSYQYTINHQEASIIENILDRRFGTQDYRAYFYIKNSTPQSIISTIQVRLAQKSESRCDNNLIRSFYKSDISTITKTVSACYAQVPPITIYADKDGAKDLYTAIDPELIRSDEVRVVTLR